MPPKWLLYEAQILRHPRTEVFEDSDIMFVTIDGKQTFQLDPAQAKCFTPGGDKMACETLAGVGDVEKARVTVMGDLVQRIDVLALQQ